MAANAMLSAATAASLFHGGSIRIGRTNLVFTRVSSSSPFSSSSCSCSPPLPLFNSHQPPRAHLYAKRIIPPYSARCPSRVAPAPCLPASAAEAEVAFRTPPAFPVSIRKSSVLWVLLLAPLCFMLLSLSCGSACAAVSTASDSIGASAVGLKIAASLRRLGWADEAVVFALATLPVLELRGAIPVGYWMQLDPIRLTILSIIGNMVPVPFIVLYLQKLAAFFSQKSKAATRFLDLLFEKAREKAGPVEEFQWLGLMLFVAVPFPGTGAWTGAIIASILGMPFWSAMSANLFGVILAGLLVNLLVNLGLKYAIVTGLVLFLVSTVMWSVLRHLKESLNSK